MADNKALEDIVITRVIDAPRERVWKALIDPEDIVHWNHADEDWTTPFAETDVRVGGTYRIGFGSPDGKNDFVLEGTYREIVEPERLVYSMGEDRVVTFVLAEEGDGTQLMLSFTPETVNTLEKQREGWTAILEHLAEYLKRKEYNNG
jgi:uncharacterized protein YndB with AHSA1/START domain